MDVTQIELHSLTSLPLTNWRDLPRAGGVYFVLALPDTVLYIGRTIDLRTRLKSHNLKLEFARFANVHVAWALGKEYYDLEGELIHRFRPQLNERLRLQNMAAISTRSERQLFKRIKDESWPRGHTRSHALEQIIKLGLPRYLKRFPKRYEPTGDVAA